MGQIAEGVLVLVETAIGRQVYSPPRHVLTVMIARRQAQDLDHAGRRRLVAIGRAMRDVDAHERASSR
jgi:hypothetical protein